MKRVITDLGSSIILYKRIKEIMGTQGSIFRVYEGDYNGYRSIILEREEQCRKYYIVSNKLSRDFALIGHKLIDSSILDKYTFRLI